MADPRNDMAAGKSDGVDHIILAFFPFGGYNGDTEPKGGTHMANLLSAYRGCLLGLAVGDAMGYTVDSRSLAEIREDYGPNGLMGYDLVNGYADVTSYTQLAAFTCNGLLFGLTRGQMQGKMAPFVRYIALSHREWAAGQRLWGRPQQTYCWLLQQKEICRRHCMDTWMLDTLGRDVLGTPEEPVNHFTSPGALTAAVGVGMFFNPNTMEQEEIDRLGAESVALTHGSPLAFLPGAVAAHLISRCLRQRNATLSELIEQSLEALSEQFGREYGQTEEICALVRQAMTMAQEETLAPVDAMERLRCETGAQVLAGSIYACLVSERDFDNAMIIAVNHSGRSAAVGALTGAILGARMGAEALPEFYLECLEPAMLLVELADDLYHGCPMEMGSRMFDGDWDRKYLHGGK